jgi:hypothetical protein
LTIGSSATKIVGLNGGGGMAELKIYAKPSSLYRYRRLGDAAVQEASALRENYIYCPAYSAMNDPMEGMHRLSTRFAGTSSSSKSHVRVQEAIDVMGIASMSEVYDHEPMWAHYAGQFTGMCVQYSLNRLIKGLDRNVAITRMMYSEREPVLLDDTSVAMDRARLSLSSKTVRWSSEREWRLFRPAVGAAHYDEPRAVTKIFLGSRISQVDEALMREVGAELRVPVARMEIDAYSMTFKPLTPIRRP